MRDNLRKILKSQYRERFVMNTFKNFACYLVDFFRISDKNDNFFKNYLSIENKQVIDEGLKKSKSGIIGLSMHLGNWEIGGGYLVFLGYKVSAVALSHSVRYIDRFFKLQRRRLGMEELPFRNSFKISIQKLKQKGIVALLCDRDFIGKYIKSVFFDEIGYLSKAPFLLGLRAQVPLIFGVTIRDWPGYKVILEGPFIYNNFSIEEMDNLAREVVKIMEKYIKSYPDQWFFFQRFWEVPKDIVII